MLANLVLLTVLGWVLVLLLVCLVLQAGGVATGVAGMLSYLLVLSLPFQAAVFLCVRTDLYVLTNLLRMENLMADTRPWLVNLAARALGRPAPHDLSDIPGREMRVIGWYAVLVTVGGGAVLAQFAFLSLPLLGRFTLDAAGRSVIAGQA